jgi:peptide/nickel transport system permease protein
MAALSTAKVQRGLQWDLVAVVRADRSALIGAIGIAVTLLVAVAGHWLWPLDPLALGPDRLQPPTWQHIMGTDDLGRDVFARVVLGAQIALVVGALSALIAILLGCLVGACSGYFGGLVDELMMRITEIFQVIPRFLLAIVIVALFGSGLEKVVLIIGLLSWPGTARIIRAQFLVLRSEEFVLAAIVGGASALRVISRHILPNVAPFLIAAAFLQMGAAILVEAFLSFLGLGDPAHPSWGLLLQQAQPYLRTAWWMAIFPGLALALTIFSLNLLGDGVGTLGDPRASRRQR